jgi:cell division protein FtsB
VGLYEEPEKPGNVIEFIKKSLGAPSDTDVDQLMAENEELKRTKADLESKIQSLEAELAAEKAKQS